MVDISHHTSTICRVLHYIIHFSVIVLTYKQPTADTAHNTLVLSAIATTTAAVISWSEDSNYYERENLIELNYHQQSKMKKQKKQKLKTKINEKYLFAKILQQKQHEEEK